MTVLLADIDLMILYSASRWSKEDEATTIFYPATQSTGTKTSKVVSPEWIVSSNIVHVGVLSCPCIENLQFLQPNTLLPNMGNCLS